MTAIVHLVGPGGAGKTTIGALLAKRLGWHFVDLDRRFISGDGGIADFIERYGYRGYARRNVAMYLEVRRALAAPTVVSLSSGFMTYPADIDERYQALCGSIESEPLTALLLPAFELEACVDIIVQRQLSRPYLPGNRASEERRIRDRFSRFIALQCARFRSDASPDKVAASVERFVRGRLGAL